VAFGEMTWQLVSRDGTVLNSGVDALLPQRQLGKTGLRQL
tara:strand:+ start:470 stop:589 length:120 start_codon:yes stop_codon:yes gene_type:complete